MCLESPELAHQLLSKYAENLAEYASFQIQSGAQILQIFESWSHHLSEQQWLVFAKVTDAV